MALIEVARYPESRTVDEYDTDTRTISTRPFTAEENAAQDIVDAEAEQTAENKSSVETNLAQDFDAMQAILNQTNAALRTDPSQEIKDIATAVRRLVRMTLDDFSGTG